MEVSPKVEEIHAPKGKSVADLIFIHSIGHDWRQTWRLSTAADSTWIKQQLPIELPHLRIGCWGCRVQKPDLLNLEAVQRAANKLLKDVNTFRITTSDQPVIFIAHSLGGVVLKQALIIDRLKKASLVKAVAGILFISVPIIFKTPESWSTFISEIHSPGTTTNRSVTGNSEPSSAQKSPRPDSRGLVAFIYKGFGELLRETEIWKPRIYSVCEAWPVYRTGVLVKPEDSITQGYSSKIVAANHFNITYLDRDTNPLYDWICNWLGAINRGDEVALDTLEAVQPSEPSHSQDLVGDPPDGRTVILRNLAGHPEARRLVSYALLLEDEGYYPEAEATWVKAIKTFEKDFRPNSLEALFCKDKLVYNYWHQGNYTTAGEKCQLLEQLKRQHLRDDPNGVLTSMRNKVLILRSEGKLEYAYEELVKSLENTQSMEKSSLEYLPNLHLVATLLNDFGYRKLSEHLFKEVVQECHSRLGQHHPYTLKRMSDLSVVFAMRGKTQQADEYNLRAYSGLEERYGMDHPAVLRAFKRYAMNKLYQGEYEESCKAFETLLPRYQGKMGESHPACLSTMAGLATASILRGSIGPGKRLLKKTHDLQTAHPSLGKNHRDTRWSEKLLILLAKVEHMEKSDRPAGSIYRDELEPFLLESWGRFGGKGLDERGNQSSVGHQNMTGSNSQSMTMASVNKSDLMPELAFLPTNTDEQKLRVELLRGTTTTDSRHETFQSYTKYTSHFGGGLIHIAAYSGNLTLVQNLLKNGADINQTAGIFRTAMKAAAMRGNTEILQVLLNHQDPSKTIEASHALTPVDTAIVFDEQAAMELLLPRYTVLPDYSSIYGEPLLQAVEDVNVEVAKLLLLRSNTDPQVRSGIARQTALEAAANIAHNSLALLRNSLHQGERLQGKYDKNRRLFELLLKNVYDRGGSSKDPLANLSLADAKHIESLQARVVMVSEESPPAYQPRRSLPFQARPTAHSNNIMRPTSSATKVSGSTSATALAEEPRTTYLQDHLAPVEASPILDRGIEEAAPKIRSPLLMTDSTLAGGSVVATEPLAPSRPLLELNIPTHHKKVPSSPSRRLYSWVQRKVLHRGNDRTPAHFVRHREGKLKNRS